MSIIHQPEDITPAWLTGVLQSGHLGEYTEVTDVEVEAIGVGVGLLGRLFRATVAGSSNLPPSVVVKLAATAPETTGVAMSFRFYEREVGFYSTLARRTPMTVPAPHYAAIDVANVQFTIVMEDIGDRELVDQLIGPTVEEAELAMTTLAAHHAAFWESSALDHHDWILAASDEPNPTALEQQANAAWQPLLARAGHLVPDAVRDVLPLMGAAARPLLETMSEGPRTLIHGDYRLDNLLFAGAESDPPLTVLDWQILGKARAGWDVAYFMTQSLPVEMRRAEEDALVRLYHDTLVGAGVTDYSFDTLWDDYRLAALFGIHYPLGTALLELANDRAVQLADAMLERSVAAIVDLDALDLMPR